MRPVLVVGGANVDIKSTSADAFVVQTSNPGTTSISVGGVGRNIAENLARLGTPTRFAGVVGRDAFASLVLRACEDAGLDTTLVTSVQGGRTGTYTALLDSDGALVGAVADTSLTESFIAPGSVCDAAGDASWLLLDANLHPQAIGSLLDGLRVRHGARPVVVIDPVSVPKAARLREALRADRPVDVLTPNADELAALGGIDALFGLGVANVWVRLGVDGSTWHGADGSVHCVPALPTRVIDVTGAGDACTAAFVHARLAGFDVTESIRFAHGAASLTVAVAATVRHDLSPNLIRSALAAG